MPRNPLEWAYKNDAVSTLVFSNQTLRRYQKKGYLKLKGTSNKGRKVYWLTKRGLAKYLADQARTQKKTKTEIEDLVDAMSPSQMKYHLYNQPDSNASRLIRMRRRIASNKKKKGR